MEDRIVAAVDGIPTIHVGADEVFFCFICSEDVGFVGGSVSAEECGFIDVVCICAAAAWMVLWEA